MKQMLSRMLIGILLVSGAFCMLSEIQTVSAAQNKADGIYSVDGVLRQASADQDSMGNAALVKPMKVYVKDGKATLHMEFQAMTAKLGATKFKGYLAELGYFPDWKGEDGSLPTGQIAEPADILSYFDHTYDSYNDPKTGTDVNIKGQLYPREMTIPVDLNDKEVWVQVYVPVMNAISAGNGLQYARLLPDWESMTWLSDLPKQPEQNTETETGTEKTVDKGSLHMILLSAGSLSEKDNLYTTESLKALKRTIEAAVKVYDSEKATQLEVDHKVKQLAQAIIALEQKKVEAEKKPGTEEKLDITSLTDGTYYLSGQMVKTDKATLSMANEAIDHRITLSVTNNTYTLSMEFTGLTINSKQGYLGTLGYFKDGYTLDSYGNPQGEVCNASVDAYQTNADGSRVADGLGTDYPQKISFPMTSEAKKDGFVVLQVFVPIMDSISPGSGRQPVFLKLDLDSLTADKDNVSSENQATISDDSTEQTIATVTDGLKSSEDLISKAVLPQNGKNERSSSKIGKQSLKACNTKSKKLTSALESQATMDATNREIDSKAFTSQVTPSSQTTTTVQNSSTKNSRTTATSTVPVVISILSAFGGLFYKIKGRG